MPIKFSGTNYLGLAQKLATSFPFSVAFWASSDAGGVDRCPVTQSQLLADRWAGMQFDANGTTVYGLYRNPGGGANVSQAVGGGALTAALKLWVVVFTSITSFKIYCNSATPTSQAVSVTNDISNHNAFTIGGVRYNSTGTLGSPLNGSIAEVAVWDGIALTDANVTSLLAGTLAETITGCTACFPLKDAADLISTNGTYTLTAVGSPVNSSLGHPVTRTAPDTTVPVLTGAITIGTVTATAIGMSWPAGSDNTAVTSYEVSKDGGSTWTDTGSTALSYNFTGLTAATAYALRVRAKDAANNVSTPALTASQTTNVSGGATAVTLPTSPTGGVVGVASTNFTVGANGVITGTLTITPSDGGAGGTFTPATVGINTASPTASFTYTPATAGAKTISFANNGSGITNPTAVTYTATVLGTLNFQAAGMEFGARSGLAISTFGLENGKSYKYTVHADGLTLGAAVITSAAITLDSAGKFPNLSSASLVAGSTYIVVAMRQSDGAAAITRMVAA